MEELELYVHIPFCVKKCAYCDFLSFPAEEKMQRKYLHTLLKEIEYYGNSLKNYYVSTIFIGGGTPSWISSKWITLILDKIRECFQVSEEAEITMESNPGTLTSEKLYVYLASGVNRLSIGLQSASNEELQKLGRIHTYEQFWNSYWNAREAGFNNINVDLIYGLPEQTADDFVKTLNTVIELDPEHISCYSLIIEPGTPFFEKYQMDVERRRLGKRTKYLPTEDVEYEMTKSAQHLLGEHGYQQYEISNFAKEGYSCRHNIGYWTGVPYIGLGLGASSYLGNSRFSNTADINKYNQQVWNLEKDPSAWDKMHRENIQLDEKARMEEFMFLGLRMNQGVSRGDFRQRFGVSMSSVYGSVIYDLAQKGLILTDHNRVFLSEKGMDLANYCMEAFLFDK